MTADTVEIEVPAKKRQKTLNGDAPSATMPVEKYRSFQSWYQIAFDDKWTKRTWPEKRLTKAPRWCSVDLRDGNQALINPMDQEKKIRLFKHLLKLGYKEIEVGFPSASQTEFDFIRHIIENKLIPDDVFIQVLTQARSHLIERTVESVKGAKNVVLHLYNSTSELQRRVVFKKEREDIKKIAVEGVKLLRQLAERELSGTTYRLEYTPESFTGTELDFALDVCEAVCDVWKPTPEDQVIVNLPSTVELCTPNVYADQIEWMCAHVSRRDCVCISLHPHNDRGTGIASAELALLAGADRVEGCLFGNGERTGNVCLMTLAMNLFTQGINPEVDFSDMQETINTCEYCTELRVPERFPWAGSLVYTAFSGSHQDAIKKGLEAGRGSRIWEVPYLPIDPSDIGRQYEAIIRVNSQSGKGGIAFLLEMEYGIQLPKDAQAEFAQSVQKLTDRLGREISPKEIYETFLNTYVNPQEPFSLVDYKMNSSGSEPDADLVMVANVRCGGQTLCLNGQGNGPVSAFVSGLNNQLATEGIAVTLSDYSSLARGHCQAAQSSEAVATVRCQVAKSKDDKAVLGSRFGVGLHGNTTTAVLRAVLSALNCIAASGAVKFRS